MPVIFSLIGAHLLSLGAQATKLDIAGKKVTFADGETLSYDSLLLATGSK